jgi:NAD(P)-dependent dehydrogenase (short-subunit alcohol dehydrogenase family)
MTRSLTGKVALVTGGSRGIGAASARALADEGANVAISYVASPDKAEAVVKELRAKGVEARAFKADQASSRQVDQLVKDVAKHFGRLDILVNSAAVAVNGAVDDPNSDTAAFDRQDAINVHGVVTAIRAASSSVRSAVARMDTGEISRQQAIPRRLVLLDQILPQQRDVGQQDGEGSAVSDEEFPIAAEHLVQRLGNCKSPQSKQLQR